MRLSKIKLAGFKSFVDPTSVNFPSNLSGVVGPNGCGKSNIIDAVRWVMGEISAKHLRGDSMTDVIFNGSGGRKPVGTASVELVFDNADGAITGPYAGFAEVSLKRSVSRDGTSIYYINGARCRRKDITQLFLGTGLGSRSYAIIEQGMISRLIEAKADDMRAFLEEAAGISKYKERRRETENRISHTRDNLERLNDVREEVEKQIRHLQRQAGVARRYQEFKEQERKLHAELLALRLRDLDADVAGKDTLALERDTALQAALAGQRSVENDIEKQRAVHVERTESLNAVQARYYQVGAEATRTEQALVHGRELRQRRRSELEQQLAGLAEATLLLDRDQAEIDRLQAAVTAAEPELGAARATEGDARAALAAAEQAMQVWQQGWDAFVRDANGAQQKTMVERTRIEQLETRLKRLLSQRERLATEKQQLSEVNVSAQLDELTQREAAAKSEGTTAQQQLEQTLADLQQSRDRERRVTGDLDRARSELQRARGQVVSLEAMQQAALGQVKGKVVEWLQGRGLADRPRLAQQLQVESGWERAIETVLGGYLEAVCVDGIDAVAELLGTLTVGQATFVDLSSTASAPAASDSLLNKLRGPVALESLLGSISAVESLDAALARRASLVHGQSVITRDGIWIGRDWLRVSRDRDEHAGVLERERELKQLRGLVAERERLVATLEAELESSRGATRGFDDRRDDLQARVNQLHREHVNLRGQLESLRSRAQQAAERLARVTAEDTDAAAEVERDEVEIREARQRLEAGLGEMQQLEDRRPGIEQQRDELRSALAAARTQAQTAQSEAQAIAIRVESHRSALASVATNLSRVQAQILQFTTRRDELDRQLTDGEAPLAELERSLAALLDQKLAVERELAAARDALESTDADLRSLEQQRLERESAVNAAREALENVRMGVQESRVRREGLLEQFAATRQDLDAVMACLAPEAAVAPWEASLAEVTGRIERLGPVNLASIDELKEQTERKEYLDRQFADLTEALETLDQAMKKIDRETRARFQETFDKVNAGLQEKFPRLFGGGQAYLELSGDDVLSAGVAVMARPPGKRNSTISQLSGGEKALTAVALVFSIFELNPAPFCLLDEVDAPLDEHNVGRFCDIVRDMSERVQFIFITHNKSTMELARQLIGVTMNEPGVSRLVTVDVDEAVRLAAV